MGAVDFLGGSAVDRLIVGSASMLVTLEWWHMPVGLNTVEFARSLANWSEAGERENDVLHIGAITVSAWQV